MHLAGISWLPSRLLAMRLPISFGKRLWASLGGLGIFGLVLAAETKKRNRRNMAIVLGILLLVMSFALVGCGSSSSSDPQRIGWNSGGHLHRRSHRHRHGQRSGAQHEPHADRSVRTHQHNQAAGRNLPAAFLFEGGRIGHVCASQR